MDIKSITNILGDEYEDLAKSIMKKDFDISKASPQIKKLLESDQVKDKLGSLTKFLDESDDDDSNGILDNVKSVVKKAGVDSDDILGFISKKLFK